MDRNQFVERWRVQALVNGSSNYNCSMVAKFLVG